MDYRFIIGGALAAAFSLTTLVHAADEKSGASSGASSEASKEFTQLDKNKDGSISRAEAKGSDHEKDFTEHDKNKDGKLSKSEFSAAEKAETSASGGTHKNKD